jgi:hypothetical protein
MSNTVEKVTGRAARTFDQFAQENKVIWSEEFIERHKCTSLAYDHQRSLM